jgi:hypothetical protein
LKKDYLCTKKNGEMKIATHNGVNIALLDEERLTDVQAALDIIGNASCHDAFAIIADKALVCDDFFDLKTRIAGEILQKFSTYSCRLMIAGSFSAYTSKALQDFMRECNRGTLIGFAPDRQTAIDRLAHLPPKAAGAAHPS